MYSKIQFSHLDCQKQMSHPFSSLIVLVTSSVGFFFMILSISMQCISQQLIQGLTAREPRFKYCIYASVFYRAQLDGIPAATFHPPNDVNFKE